MGGMNMPEAIGAGIRDARQRKGWRQEDAAVAFRDNGLRSWRTGTVGQVEVGLRKSGLDELLPICVALGVSLAELIPDTDERIEFACGAAMTARAARALLSSGRLPADATTTTGATPAAGPSDAERHAASRLGVEAAQLQRTAHALWGRSLDEERDARIVGLQAMAPRSRQARRGHVARILIGELQETKRPNVAKLETPDGCR